MQRYRNVGFQYQPVSLYRPLLGLRTLQGDSTAKAIFHISWRMAGSSALVAASNNWYRGSGAGTVLFVPGQHLDFGGTVFLPATGDGRCLPPDWISHSGCKYFGRGRYDWYRHILVSTAGRESL